MQFAVSLIEAMQTDLNTATAILEQSTQIFNQNVNFDADHLHPNHLGSLDNLENDIINLYPQIEECSKTIQSLRQELTEDNITVSMLRKIKEACSTQLTTLSPLKNSTVYSQHEFISQTLMRTICGHDSLSEFTNTDGIPCDGCETPPSPENARVLHLTSKSVILQQMLCNNCMRIFCTCCSA